MPLPYNLPPDSAPYVADEDLLAWITERVDVDSATARIVLAVEFEHMVGAGILSHDCPSWAGFGCDHFVPEWHSREQLGAIGGQAIVDPARVAIDVEALTGISADLAIAVFEAEIKYLAYRGLAHCPRPPR